MFLEREEKEEREREREEGREDDARATGNNDGVVTG